MIVLRSSNLSSEIHKYRPLSSCHALPADRRNKALECWLATLNASSAKMSHALEQTNAARIEVICHSAVSKLPTSCLQGYSVSLQNIQGSSICFWEAMFATRPIALAVTLHTLPWKGLKNAPFLFLVWHPPCFFSFSGMVWRLPV